MRERVSAHPIRYSAAFRLDGSQAGWRLGGRRAAIATRYTGFLLAPRHEPRKRYE